MRKKSNMDRDRNLERIGFNLAEETALTSRDCQVCGYDRLWTAERYRDWCAYCGVTTASGSEVPTAATSN